MIESRRITLLNPHADDFVKTPVSFWLTRRRGLRKYAYLIDEPARRGRPVDILIDGTLSSLWGQGLFVKLPLLLRRLVLHFEIYLWIAINRLKNDVVVHWTPETVADRGALYIFSYKNCVEAFEKRKPAIDAFSQKLINLSHYFIRTGEKARNISRLRNTLLIAEADMSGNPYYMHYFPGRPLCVVPFAVSERFATVKSLAARGGICAATGSFHNLQDEKPRSYYEEFVNFFKLDTYHPVRKLLYQHKNELKGQFDIRTSFYREKSSSSEFIAKLLSYLGLDIAQTEYFSFDIVDFYCDHKFAIVGEEASGLPAIGFFEAMACGCVMLGQQGHFYDGLGLTPGVHYLAHDGTIKNIRALIDSALKDPERLEQISEAGKKYISEHCLGPAVWDKLQHCISSATTQI